MVATGNLPEHAHMHFYYAIAGCTAFNLVDPMILLKQHCFTYLILVCCSLFLAGSQIVYTLSCNTDFLSGLESMCSLSRFKSRFCLQHNKAPGTEIKMVAILIHQSFHDNHYRMLF